jgi:hypothetical protein
MIEPDRPVEPLRVGVMLDALQVPAWIARILRQLLRADFVHLALVVLNGETPAAPRTLDRLRRPRRDRLLFNLYHRLDSRIFRSTPDAFAPEDMADELVGVPAITAEPSRPKPFEHRFSAETVDEIRAARLDVAVRFGFNIIRGDILDVARYGVWSYHHGDHREYRGVPALFWEMYEGNPVSGTMLQVLEEQLDAGRVLYRSFSATDKLSLNRGSNRAYWKSAEFVIRCLTMLHERGWDYLASRPEYLETVSYNKPIYRSPTNGQTLRFLLRTAVGALVRQLDKRLVEYQWHIAYRRTPDSRENAARELPPGGSVQEYPFRLVGAPPGRWYADPTVVEDRGRHHLFFEDYDMIRETGGISWLALNEGLPTAARSVLAREYHMSYPFVFRWEDAWYMTPETGANRTVELWRATEFPEQWELERVLLADVDAVDPTAFAHDGRFYLFVNLAVPGASLDDELCLFHADSPGGTLLSHPVNPVVSDVRRARPAGGVFVHDGMLIRPSQDCSRRYGGLTVFNWITTLSQTEYAEEPIGQLGPSWLRGSVATHTFNGTAVYQVVDAQRRELKLLRRTRSALGRRCRSGRCSGPSRTTSRSASR